MKTIKTGYLHRHHKDILSHVTEPFVVTSDGEPWCMICPVDRDAELMKEQWRIDRLAEKGDDVPVAKHQELSELDNLEGFEDLIAETADFGRTPKDEKVR